MPGCSDAADYNYAALGLTFLKCADCFEERRGRLEAERAQSADPEDPDEYRSQSIFWVLPEAPWSHLKAQSAQPPTGRLAPSGMAGFVLANGSTSSSQFWQSVAYLKMHDED